INQRADFSIVLKCRQMVFIDDWGRNPLAFAYIGTLLPRARIHAEYDVWERTENSCLILFYECRSDEDKPCTSIDRCLVKQALRTDPHLSPRSTSRKNNSVPPSLALDHPGAFDNEVFLG
ncbi:MAG: hypothetical protein WCX16_05355, partial [Candidatus Omnitrophota bacterium]